MSKATSQNAKAKANPDSESGQAREDESDQEKAIELTPQEFRDIRAKAAQDALDAYGLQAHDTVHAIPKPLYEKVKDTILYFLDDNAVGLSDPFEAADLLELELSRERKLTAEQLAALKK